MLLRRRRCEVTAVRPISLLRLSLPRLLDSNFPGNPPWALRIKMLLESNPLKSNPPSEAGPQQQQSAKMRISESRSLGKLSAAVFHTKILHAKILWIKFPAELPVLWGISPLENKTLTDSSSRTYRILIQKTAVSDPGISTPRE